MLLMLLLHRQEKHAHTDLQGLDVAVFTARPALFVLWLGVWQKRLKGNCLCSTLS
jgi:hypothetical protein